MSLIRNKKRRGHIIDPWGTAHLIKQESEAAEKLRTHYIIFSN